MSVGIRERLILLQLRGESPLFKHLNLIRMANNNDLTILGPEEARYFEFYRQSFELEVLAIALMLPLAGFSFQLYNALKTIKVDARIIKNRVVRVLLLGVPTLNLFLFNGYRRYFHVLDCEKKLELKYAREIREMQKNKRKIIENNSKPAEL